MITKLYLLKIKDVGGKSLVCTTQSRLNDKHQGFLAKT